MLINTARPVFIPGRILIALVIVFLSVMTVRKAEATHAMAVDLTYECIGGNEYEFTLSFYRDCKGISAPSTPVLHIESRSCNFHTHINLTRTGPGVEVSAVCPSELSNTSCNGGTIPGVQKYIYKGRYTLPAQCTDWRFSYSECCRNYLITNLATKNDLYVEATLNNRDAVCNSSPVFTNMPVPYLCNGQAYSYNHGVIDANGDSLVYSLITPLEGYNDPATYKPGYSSAYPIFTNTGSLQFDAATGQMDLTPNGLQVSVVTVMVKEYRSGRLIGTTMRDMQVIVSNCTNLIPHMENNGGIQNHSGGILSAKNIIEICPGETIDFDISARDNDGDNITASSNISSSIPGAVLNLSATGNTATGHFSWTPQASDLGIHTFTVTLKDDACPVSGEQTYSFTIYVLQGTSAGPDRHYCPDGATVQLKAIGGSVFQWTNLDGSPATSLSCTNCANPVATPSVTTTYIVESNFSSGCGNRDTITVHLVPSFTLSTSPQTQLCSMEEGVTIQAYAGPDPGDSYSYQWTPSANLSGSATAVAVARPKTTTQYYVTVVSPQGCTKTDSVIVTAKNLIEMEILQGDTIETCDSVRLNLVFIPVGEIFHEAFDHDIDSSNWSNISGGILGNQCGAVSHNEAYHLRNPGVRTLETKDMDLENGASISFYVKAGTCNQCFCDKPENDEQDENLYLEYSIDGGATWTLLHLMDADIFSAIDQFNYIALNIPDEAKTTHTRFRWQQLNNHPSLPDKDIWILDDIRIREGLGDYDIQWTPSTGLSSDTIANPVAAPLTTTTYIVQAMDKETGCVYIDTVTVVFKEEFQITERLEITLCPEDTNYRAQIPGPTGTVYTYKWLPPAGLSDPNIPNPILSPSESTIYAIFISNGQSGCYRQAEMIVNVPPVFTIDIGLDTSVCFTDSVALRAVPSTPEEDYDYLWRPVHGVVNQTSASTYVKPTLHTEYIVFVRNKETNCTKADTVNVKVYPNFNLTTTKTATLCPYQSEVTIAALAEPGNDFTYLWSPSAGMADPSLRTQDVTATTDSTFYVLAHKDEGCWKRDSVRVSPYQGSLTLGASQDTLIHEGATAPLRAWGAEQYLWKNESVLVSEQNQFMASPVTKTIYTVYGSDACYVDSQQVTVDVIPIEFFIPNLITPNGDGLNDNFRITNFGTKWNLEIYNRWGQLVYQREKYINEWNGDGQNDGVYYYHITDTKTLEMYKGWVEIIR